MLVFDAGQIDLSLVPIPNCQQCTNGNKASGDSPKSRPNEKPQNNLGCRDEDRKTGNDASQGAESHKECVCHIGQFWAVVKVFSIHCRSLVRAPGSSALIISSLI